jgi:hypothetical protein
VQLVARADLVLEKIENLLKERQMVALHLDAGTIELRLPRL